MAIRLNKNKTFTVADFWESIKNIFKASEASNPNQPVIHEIITRTEAEKIAFERWKNSLVAQRMLDWLNHQYSIYVSGNGQLDHIINFLNLPSAKGFVIRFEETNYSKEEITFFFDWLAEKVLALDYRNYMSDTKTFNRQNWVETRERHYLKPLISSEELAQNKFNQSYGNINIELVLMNDKVKHLKFSATTYHDANFKEARRFESLMEHLVVKS